MADVSIDEILASAVRRSATARVLFRQDLVVRHAELVAALEDARDRSAGFGADGSLDDDGGAAGIEAAARAVVEFEAEIEGSLVDFRFESIGRRAWSDLLAKHPPTKEQLRAKPRLDHNEVTFPIAAIAASCVSPQMNLEQAAHVEQVLDLSQWAKLWQACLDANVGDASTPKSAVAGGILRASAPSATTAALVGSHGRSSSVG